MKTPVPEAKRPHLLFFGTKWIDLVPEKGLGIFSSALTAPFEATGLGTYDSFFADEYYHTYHETIDAALIAQCERTRPDLFVLNWAPSVPDHFNPKLETLYTIHSVLKIPVVAMWWDTWEQWLVELAESMMPLVDLTVSPGCIDHFRQSAWLGKCIELLAPFDPRVFYDPELERDIDLSFNGGLNNYPDRIAGLAALRAAGINVVKTGGQHDNPLSIEDYARVFMRSKITLNFSRSGAKLTIKGRLFEATMCGTMLLESYNPETPKWFEPMQDYVPFADEKDLVEKARYYLEHEEERKAIALRGKQKVQHIVDGKIFWERVLTETKARWQAHHERPGQLSGAIATVEAPLVSIITTCKNSASTIRRCVESVLALGYTNLEYVVQDGASTDGTLEILQEYAHRCPERVKLVSEPDANGAEGFFRALRRCTGDIIGSCLADEELLPHAAVWAAAHLNVYPEAGAIYGDHYTTDLHGNIQSALRPSNFDLVGYICSRWTPPFCSSFFRRSALEAIGLYEREWALDVGEFELWIRLGLQFPIRHLGGLIAKYAVYPEAASVRPDGIRSWAAGKARWLPLFFAEPDLPDAIRAFREQALADVRLWEAECYLRANAFADARSAVEEALRYQADQNWLTAILRELLQYAVQRMYSGYAVEALSYFDLAQSAQVILPNLYFCRALALSKIGWVKDAIEGCASRTYNSTFACRSQVAFTGFDTSLYQRSGYSLGCRC